MVGVSLSRWSMAYFAVALLALVAAEGLMVAGFGFPAAPLQAPQTLVLVHLVAIGWLSLLMLGALFQFVPVLVTRPIYSNSLPFPVLVLLIAGLAALLLAFVQLAGVVAADAPFFAAASALLAAGFALAAWNLGRTLWSARPLGLPARFVVTGLLSLAATVALGTVFALVFAGQADAPQLIAIGAAGVPIHAIAGVGGWLTFTAIGVSYRLLAMFMLAPDEEKSSSRIVLATGTGALAVAVIGGVAAICTGTSPALPLTAAGILGLAALALYGGDVVHLFRARKRRTLELNSRMAALALVSLALAALLGLALLALGEFASHVGDLAFLLAFGWLTGLGLAMLYKIVAFLTWLECYGPVLGRSATPRVQDLVDEPRAARWFLAYFSAVWIGTVALLAGAPSAFRGAAAVMALATCGIVMHLARTRRLAVVLRNTPLPEGACRPRLLFAHSR